MRQKISPNPRRGPVPTGDAIAMIGAVVTGISVLLFVCALISFFVLPSESIASLLPDDAFYYFKIARNFVKGYGFSFDAINPTNGYQPLWMYLLLIPAYITREMHVEVFPRVALVYQAILLLLAVVLLHSAMIQRCNLPAVLTGDAFTLVLGLRLFVNGMETTTVFLVFASIIWYLSRQTADPPGTTYFALVGLLSGILFLSRLDSVFILLAWMVGHALLRKQLGMRWSHLLLMAGMVGLVAAPYLLYNYVIFGDWMPISGRLKSSFPRVEHPDLFRVPLQFYLVLVICLFATLWLWRKIEQPRMLLLFLLAWSAGSWVHALHTVLFMKWAVFNWHFSSYWVPLTTVVPLLLTRWQPSRYTTLVYLAGMMVWIAITLLLGRLFWQAWRGEEIPNWHRVGYRAALWARQNTPASAVFAMKDCGVFGYYSDRRVVNLDGVVNNRELQMYLHQQQLARYLARKGVRFLVQHAVHERSTAVEDASSVAMGAYERTSIRYVSRLYGTVSDAIPLQRKQERFRQQAREGVYLIWELRSAP
ncbi:MAG: hypothetical protein KatS3mg022_2202 [Armatimonadota bacterium]|nr:MAG: hypothetical protein KatS3mg022_2202 [Armatimonadota bacterium]